MSPEQSLGEELDHRTDIWSVGIVLYEMITGKKPFKGAYDQAIIYSILNENLQSLKFKEINVPDKFEKVIQRLLKKRKAERFSSLEEVNF